MKRLTFIHAADLHLDSPMVGLKSLPEQIFKRLQESTFEAFGKIVDSAILHNVDFVIIAGDLFDGEDRSIRAQTRFIKEMKRLEEKHIPVFAVHGNHDHMEGNWTHLPMPENVYIFPHDVTAKTFTNYIGTSVNLYGFSYPKRHVYERMIQRYEKKNNADFHIGILHGQLEGNSDHGTYAPFTLKELLDKGFDYWALGHIHKRNQVNLQPPVIYPGNIQGRNRKELGAKGCYLVQLTDGEAEMTFIESSTVNWRELTIDAAALPSFHEIYAACKKTVDQFRLDHKGIILTLTLENVDIPHQDYKSLENGDLLEILQEDEKEEKDFVWIADLLIKEKLEWTYEQLSVESDFYQELFQTASNNHYLNQSISSLYDHPSARKYLDELSDEEKSRIAGEAEKLLVNLLYKPN
ncbi:DNA repair exonuclease [Cytobacillus praedii]|uniref:metallophosphoesterase family protein n=1 Tax=Cytobacillus praedii TaxID=1742358 RepID=UPI002E228454|nr:DNA repair exonuclease [Cytobacillus praedii]